MAVRERMKNRRSSLVRFVTPSGRAIGHEKARVHGRGFRLCNPVHGSGGDLFRFRCSGHAFGFQAMHAPRAAHFSATVSSAAKTVVISFATLKTPHESREIQKTGSCGAKKTGFCIHGHPEAKIDEFIRGNRTATDELRGAPRPHNEVNSLCSLRGFCTIGK